MMNRFSAKMVPLMAGMLSSWLYTGCGGQDIAQTEQEEVTTTTTAAQINQTDINNFTNDIKLSSCTFVVAAGTATFTPSSQLSQVLYGDPNGNAHKTTFAVPPISSGGATITVTSLNAEMASTGITLSGSNATVKVSFDGMLHATIPVPVFGKVSTDIQINSSSVSVALVYNSMTELASSSGVTSNFNVAAKNCGGSGWCNGIVNNVLKTNLNNWVDTPLQNAITKALDSASATAKLDSGLVAAYNLKNKQATPWTMVPHTLTLASGAFNFTAQRN